MRNALIALMISGMGTSAFAATAYFTGEMRQVQSVTGAIVWNCKYQYAGQYFWRAYSGSCPSSIEIE